MDVYIDREGTNLSLLVVNRKGIMRRLYVPFRVICIREAEGIRPYVQLYVEKVIGGIKGEINYIIFNRPYPHYFFHIIIQF
jgi:hypothetical protein